MRPRQAYRGADQRPVFVLDLAVKLGAQPGGGDWRSIPADRGVRLRLFDGGKLCRGELLATGLKCGFAALVDLAFHLLDQDRKARFGVARDVEVDLLIAAEILIVGLHVEAAGAKRDDLGGLLVS